MSYRAGRLTYCCFSQDVGVTAECERCVQETIKNLGGLDILIGNAVCSLNAETRS